MNDDAKFNLVELTKEEATAFSKDMDAVISKHSIYFRPIPKIQTEGPDKPFTLTAELFAMKKVELVPKGVESPYADNKEEPNAAPEKSSEGDSGESAPTNA